MNEHPKTSPLRTLCAAGAIAAAAVAPAAETATQQTQQTQQVEEVIVIGTAIKGTPIDAPYAVDVLDRDDLVERGEPALADLFKNLGANAGSIGEVTSWLNGTGQAVPESAASVNLRGFGPSRTLVLLNGRRQVYVPAQLTGGRFVDVNAIPLIAIERVEVLKEGAAAVYGSDAIAGVVDFVTRSGFEGFEIAGAYEHFDGAGDDHFGAIWGGALGATHAVLAIERAHRQSLNLAERDFTLPDDGSAYWGWSGTGNPGAFIVPAADADPGAPLSQNLATAPRFVDPRCIDAGGEDWRTTCGFRFGPWDNLIESQSALRAFAELQGDIGLRSGYRLEALFAQADIPGWLTTPSSPPVAAYDGMQRIAADHPGRIALAERYATLPASDGGEIDLTDPRDWYYFGRLAGNGGPGRQVPRDTTTYRLAASIDGSTARLDYDVGVVFSRAEGLMNRPAEYAYRRFLAFRGFGGAGCGVGAVASPRSPSGLELGPIPQGVAPGQGVCRYYNPFSNALQFSAQPGAAFSTAPNPDYRADLANDPALLGWIGEQVRVRNGAELRVFDAIVSWDWIPDRISVAAGYQWRRFSAWARPEAPADLSINPCWIPGDTACASPTGLFASARGRLPFDAAQSIHSAFTEFAIKAGERWDVQIAGHYERHGGTSSFDPKLAARLSLGDALALRASVQTTFRTPSVDDLNPDIDTKLELLPSVGTFKAIETQGNPSLDPESALTVNLGAVLQTANVDATLDYWRYRFRDPITVLPFAAVEAAYADPQTRRHVQALVFCPGGRSDGSCSAAEVERIRVQSINGPTVHASGIDARIGGGRPLGDGELVWGADATFILAHDVDALHWGDLQLAPAFAAAGYLNDPVDGAVPPLPRLKTTLHATFRWGAEAAWSASGLLHRVSSYRDRDRQAGTRFSDIDAFAMLDLTLVRRLPARGLVLSLAVLNAADASPPPIGADHFFDGMTHNPKGRRIKLGLRYAR